ncbi:terminase [Cloacibacillus sp. An23]|nr:terminase [Cloacibacillus sp. An23]
MSGFVRYTYPSYLMGWCHEEICLRLDRFLDDVRARRSPRLIICMPPRSGKSELASRRFPAYAFGREPNISVIAASYSADLASRINRDVQRIMDDAPYLSIFSDTRLPGANARTGRSGYVRNNDIFEIVGHNGSYRSAGVGGGINGMGADIMIIDDPFKSRAEADSPTIREKIWDWYTSTFYTRLAPGGGILVIATRWHMDDLTGRLIEAAKTGEGDQWEIVDYPAIATCDEAHRKKGEALHPERYPLDQLMRIKAAIGTRDWEALYQQHPTVEGGAVFRTEWLRLYNPADLPQSFDETIISWDMTFKEGDDKDFVVGQVWARKDARYFLLDQVRRQMDFVATMEAFVALSQKYPRALKKLVEDKANGPAVISALKSHVPGIVPIEPDGSKTARAYAVTPLFEAGNVYIPNPSWCQWAREYIDELTQFPTAAHDDQVDATTQALRQFTARPSIRINPSILQPRGLYRR